MTSNHPHCRWFASFALLSILGTSSIPSPAYASFISDINGRVGAINTPSGGGSSDHSCSYSSGTTTSTNLGNSCNGNSTAGGGFLTENGVASSSVDHFGLHAYASQSLSESGHSALGEAQAESNSSAQAQDDFHFGASSPSSGRVNIAYSLDGFGFVGAALIIENPDNRSSSSCTLNASGTCTVSLLVNFQAGFTVIDNIFVEVLSRVGGSDGDTNLVVSDYRNTASISAINFFDANGEPLQLTFTTDSGFSYPQGGASTTIPEPAPWLLMAIGLLVFNVTKLSRPIAPQ